MIETIVTTERTVYFIDREFHRPNGPASVWNDGKWYWYLNGRSHRYYGPQHHRNGWCIHGEDIK